MLTIVSGENIRSVEKECDKARYTSHALEFLVRGPRRGNKKNHCWEK